MRAVPAALPVTAPVHNAALPVVLPAFPPSATVLPPTVPASYSATYPLPEIAIFLDLCYLKYPAHNWSGMQLRFDHQFLVHYSLPAHHQSHR